MKVSAGCLMYRNVNGELEFFLVHPGGPAWANKDTGAWSIPKGLVDGDESTETTARREFEEEVGIKVNAPLLYLNNVVQKSGKMVHCYAFKTDIKGDITVNSNTCDVQWMGKTISISEVDKGEFFTYKIAKEKINSDQIPFIERLMFYVNKSEI